MRITKVLFSLAGLLATASWALAANDFSQDASVLAVYNLESGALTTDSKGSNTLTNNGPVVFSTTMAQQGAGSGLWTASSSTYMVITNTNLPSTWPGKDGTTNRDFGFAGWIRIDAMADETFYGFASKFQGGGTRSYATYFQDPLGGGGSEPQAGMSISYNAGASTEDLPLHDTVLSLSTPYHVTFTYRNSDKAWAIRVRDTSGNIVGADKTGTATLDATGLSPDTADFTIGVFNNIFYADAYYDEIVVFNRFVTAEDSTNLSKGIFGSARNLMLLGVGP